MKLNPALINIMIISIRKKEEQLENLMNLRFGQVCATIANTHSKRKRFKSTDFFKKIEHKKNQSLEEMAKVLKKFTISMGGTVNG